MAYLHDHRYSFPGELQPHMLHYAPLPYPYYQPQTTNLDSCYPGYRQAEYAEFGYQGFVPDDFDDGSELSTRPRLTKEQVEVLEGQFQANHKPNSLVKRQLAVQTRLTLPRVANWFQNRRAKAKQQRKQEEYENAQAQAASKRSGWQSEDNLTTSGGNSQTSDSKPSDLKVTQKGIPTESSIPAQQRPSSSPTDLIRDPAQGAGWASLQRALNAAQAARAREAQDQNRQVNVFPPAATVEHGSLSAQSSQSEEMAKADSTRAWTHDANPVNHWTSLPLPEHIPFDFGFDLPLPTTDEPVARLPDFGPGAGPTLAFPNLAETWIDPSSTTALPPQAAERVGMTPSSVDPASSYSNSRRGSTTEELANNFGTFALAGTPPNRPPMPLVPNADSIKRVEGEIDIAARRKRPRPAALGQAALRSRSYGALTSMSPTMRSSAALPNTHSLRHVKSMGHSLNAKFAGVRKPSSAQRSPLNISTFAEAESFNSLLAQQSIAAAAAMEVQETEVSSPFVKPELRNHSQIPVTNVDVITDLISESRNQFALDSSHHLHPPMTSPPVTPFTTEFTFTSPASTMMPPASAPPQCTTFPDYTPPYSAGPLTSSSWSDAPLLSPDLPNFPPVTQIPNVTFSPQQEGMIPYQQLMQPPEQKPASGYPFYHECKKTEFFIQEFPGQKEEHAHVAQQLAPNKPKSYVFNNATPNDF